MSERAFWAIIYRAMMMIAHAIKKYKIEGCYAEAEQDQQADRGEAWQEATAQGR